MFICLIYIYSFGDNQVKTENVKVTIFFFLQNSLEFLFFAKVTVVYWIKFFHVTTVIKIESDSGTASVAPTGFIKLH